MARQSVQGRLRCVENEFEIDSFGQAVVRTRTAEPLLQAPAPAPLSNIAGTVIDNQPLEADNPSGDITAMPEVFWKLDPLGSHAQRASRTPAGGRVAAPYL